MDYQNMINQKIQKVKPSGIRRFFDIAAEMDDVISLSIGEPDFQTPEHIRNVGIESLQKGQTKYTSNSGLLELRRLVGEYYQKNFGVSYNGEKETLITVGGSEAVDLALRVLINPGDEVLIPEPNFVCYGPLTEMNDGVPVTIETKAEHEFRLMPEELLEKITPRTKLLILAYPNNPTGGIMEREDLEKIAEIILAHNLLVITDEIYAALTYGGKSHCSIASIPGMFERTVVISGFSKAFAMTGWRLGYAFGPLEIIKAMTKMHQYGIMSAPTTAQYAAVEAMRHGMPDTIAMRDEYDRRRRYVVDRLNAMGLDCFEPRGAFYCFPSIQKSGLNSEAFCERLLREKHVAVIPGTAFGNCGEGFVRISYSYSMEHLQTAMDLIEEFLQTLS